MVALTPARGHAPIEIASVPSLPGQATPPIAIANVPSLSGTGAENAPLIALALSKDEPSPLLAPSWSPQSLPASVLPPSLAFASTLSPSSYASSRPSSRSALAFPSGS